MNKNIKISLITDNNNINTNSTLSVFIDDKEYFLSNSHSWLRKKIDNPYLKLEYICLSDNQFTDTIIIEYDSFTYKINCNKDILVLHDYGMYGNFYIDLSYSQFIQDPIDINAYNQTQIFCEDLLLAKQLPAITCNMGDQTIIFNKWFNIDHNLLFYSKSTQYNSQALLLIAPNRSIFSMSLRHESLVEPSFFYSASNHWVISNEIGQIKCSDIKFQFDVLIPVNNTVIVTDDYYYDINTNWLARRNHQSLFNIVSRGLPVSGLSTKGQPIIYVS